MLKRQPGNFLRNVAMRKGKITIIDIARLSGVSITTVSRVINNQRVKQMTREKVLKVIEKYEYHPNTYAQYLGKRNHKRFS